jgi:hypothetical protein
MTFPTAAPGFSPDSNRTKDAAYAGGRGAMRARQRSFSGSEDNFECGWLPCSGKTLPCYVQHLPSYGINREEQNIYLISGDKISAFARKSADNREEKNFFPCSFPVPRPGTA